MHARVSIPAWAKAGVALLIVGVAACAQRPCDILLQNAERVRAGGATELASDRWRIRSLRGTGTPMRASRVEAGDFLGSMRTRDVRRCLRADWRESTEAGLRSGWTSQATRFEREGWPRIVSLEQADGDYVSVQVLVEADIAPSAAPTH